MCIFLYTKCNIAFFYLRWPGHSQTYYSRNNDNYMKWQKNGRYVLIIGVAYQIAAAAVWLKQ